VDLATARRCLEGAARVLESGLVYPNPGYHCRECSQPRCRLGRSSATPEETAGENAVWETSDQEKEQQA
jgi:hypothetical protein